MSAWPSRMPPLRRRLLRNLRPLSGRQRGRRDCAALTTPRPGWAHARRGRDFKLGDYLTAADLRDQADFACLAERRAVGVLEDLAIDRDRHAALDIVA